MTIELTTSQRRQMAVDEGSRVYVLVLRALLSELGVEGTNKFAHDLLTVEVDNEQDFKVRDRLGALLIAATAHGADLAPRVDDTDWIVDRAWRDAQSIGARVYALSLRASLEASGPEDSRRLATKMDEVSVEGADVFGVRSVLGLPEKEGDGKMQDWINFMGTGWSVIADETTDWEWVDVSDERSTMRVHRCPYWSAMNPAVRDVQPCEQGCSTYLDTAAQMVHPLLRLRGDANAVAERLGYERSLPKGDSCCELTVAFGEAGSS